MWSLATEDRKGIDNRQEAIPLTVDPQYNVGFTWARQYGFRVVKNFGDKFALAIAIEGPQATIGGRGFSNVTTINNGAAPSVIQPIGWHHSITGNTFLDAIGAGGGLFNFIDATGYTVNKSPDIIIKAALDPGFGHYELFGIISTFRNRIYPCGVVGTNANDTVLRRPRRRSPAVRRHRRRLAPLAQSTTREPAAVSAPAGAGRRLRRKWNSASRLLPATASAVTARRSLPT